MIYIIPTTALLIILVWITYMIERLKNVPVEQIKAMADFFRKVIPSIPITGILKVLQRGKPDR